MIANAVVIALDVAHPADHPAPVDPEAAIRDKINKVTPDDISAAKTNRVIRNIANAIMKVSNMGGSTDDVVFESV